MSAENPRYALFYSDPCCGMMQEFWLQEPDCIGIDIMPGKCGSCGREIWFRFVDYPPPAITYKVELLPPGVEGEDA